MKFRQDKERVSVATVGSFVIASGLAFAFGSPSFAGVADSPLPTLTLSGSPARVVFLVPSVVKNNNLDTDFMCTSLETTITFKFGVEVFSENGGPPLNIVNAPTLDGVETLAPGESRTIGTRATVGVHEDQVIAALAGVSVKNGSARIVSESTRIMCSALVLDKLGDPPASMAELKVIRKKQKGD